MSKLKAITTEAKKLYKTGKFAKWTDAIKAASQSISGYQKTIRKGQKTFVKYSNAAKKKKAVTGYEKTIRKGADTYVQYSVLPKKKAAKKAVKKAAPKKLQQGALFGTGSHKDSRSHNVNIRVLSGFFDTSIIKELDDLKKQYYKLAKKYHPDAGGTTAQFQDLQKEYDKLFNAILKGSNLNADQQKNETELDEAIRAFIDAIIHLEGITVEVIGKWLWVGSGIGIEFESPTYYALKKAGLEYIRKAGRPYMVYKGSESRGRGKMSMDEIRAKYGSQKFEPGKGRRLTGIKKLNKTKIVASLKKVLKALDKRPI